jgi:hypothetical protein
MDNEMSMNEDFDYNEIVDDFDYDEIVDDLNPTEPNTLSWEDMKVGTWLLKI